MSTTTEALNSQLQSLIARLNPVVAGLERVFKGGEDETVYNGAQNLLTQAGLIKQALEAVDGATQGAITGAIAARDEAVDAAASAQASALASGAPLATYVSYNDPEAVAIGSAPARMADDLASLADGLYEILSDETNGGAATRYTVASHVATFLTTLEASETDVDMTATPAWSVVKRTTGRGSSALDAKAQQIVNNIAAIRRGLKNFSIYGAADGNPETEFAAAVAAGLPDNDYRVDVDETRPGLPSSIYRVVANEPTYKNPTSLIGDDGDKYIAGKMAFGGALRRRQYDRNADEVSIFEVINPALISAIRDGTITSDLSVQLQTALSEQDIRNYFVPDGTYPVDAGLIYSLRGNVRWSANAILVPRGSGVTGALLTIDGSDASAAPAISEEHAIRTRWDRIRLDGLNRYPALSGLVIQNVLRSDFGAIICENFAGSALSMPDSVKESTIDMIRSKYCGEIVSDGMGGFTESPVLDVYQKTSARDPHNNLRIKSFYSIYGMGPDIRVGGSDANSGQTRRIHFDFMMVHGSIDIVSPPVSEPDAGDPYKLTDAQRVSRKQIIVGNADEVYFHAGSLQFAATGAYPIHVVKEGTSTTGLVYFGPIRVHQRYDYSGRYGPASAYTGLRAEAGEIINDGLRFVAGYSSHNSFEAIAGVKVHWNALTASAGDGGVSIVDSFEIFHRNTIHNFGAKELRNIGDLKCANAAISIREGRSAYARAAATFDYSASSDRARFRVPSASLFELADQTAEPTVAQLTADGVGSCMWVVGGSMRYFNHTLGTVSDVMPAHATSTQFSSATDVINTKGKSEGTQVWDSSSSPKKPLWSSGSAATDAWCDAAGAVVYTPA